MDKKSYFECKRCFYKCYQKGDILKHLTKKKLCNRTIESFNYSDAELKNLSLVRIYLKHDDNENYDIKCEDCCKNFICLRTLKKHKDICKFKKKTEENVKENVKEKVDKTSFETIKNIIVKNDNCNINITDNSINNITQNISLNINLINSFDEQWNITHIDDNKKLLLLLNNTKFTSTLENILENEVNLNVLIDDTSDNGLVYNEKKITNMDIKDIVKNTMDKLFNHLCNFRNDILEPNKYNIDKNIIEEQLKIAELKYNDYKINKDNIEKVVDDFIKDIYNKKKDDTILNYQQIIKKEGY